MEAKDSSLLSQPDESKVSEPCMCPACKRKRLVRTPVCLYCGHRVLEPSSIHVASKRQPRLFNVGDEPSSDDAASTTKPPLQYLGDEPFYEVANGLGVGRVWPELEDIGKLIQLRGVKLESKSGSSLATDVPIPQELRLSKVGKFDPPSGRLLTLDLLEQRRGDRSYIIVGNGGKDVRTPTQRNEQWFQ
jgi:hypothetical protein